MKANEVGDGEYTLEEQVWIDRHTPQETKIARAKAQKIIAERRQKRGMTRMTPEEVRQIEAAKRAWDEKAEEINEREERLSAEHFREVARRFRAADWVPPDPPDSDLIVTVTLKPR